MTDNDINYISLQSGQQKRFVEGIIRMFTEGMTVPFISRYRKEKTGSMNEVSVQKIKDYLEYVTELNERKKTILKGIENQGKLNAGLLKQIKEIYNKNELEDLYLPYKPEKKTKASVARGKGLKPLADKITGGRNNIPLNELAEDFVSLKRGIKNVEEALEGAGYIIAEFFSQNTIVRKNIRKVMGNQGLLKVDVTQEWKDKRSKFEQYYVFREALKTLPSHRILAVMRGIKEKVLKAKIMLEKTFYLEKTIYLLNLKNSPYFKFLQAVLLDSLKRLILPSIEIETLAYLKSRADQSAIGVFASNLEHLLLSSPAGSINVLGVDPGFRTGCKLTVINETGKLLDHAVIYPVEPGKEIVKSRELVNDFLQKYRIKAVSIGNGTAGRETYAFFKHHISCDVIITMVNEAGASVYSASPAGREEFPDHDLTVRGSVSIARRLQDPLAELVKIEPKSIGVGQYQHDINQKLLKDRLDNVVTSVVNRVGVDLNTASVHLFKYISGINQRIARNIVLYREDRGMIQSREDLKNINGFGDKAYLQAAGFLRISRGESVLDTTRIHPETYFIVDQMAEKTGVPVENLLRNKNLLKGLDPAEYVCKEFGLPTVMDIITELEAPGRDIRKDFAVIDYKEGIEKIEDLTEGMELNGIVTNVTNFGAFVDIGVHQDGLVHISQLSSKYVKDPLEVIFVGDKIRVKVLKVDLVLKRIQLSKKALE